MNQGGSNQSQAKDGKLRIGLGGPSDDMAEVFQNSDQLQKASCQTAISAISKYCLPPPSFTPLPACI